MAYGAKKGGEHVYMNVNANEDALYRLRKNGVIRHYRVVHFATHGLFDSDNPSLNALVLTIPDAAKKRLLALTPATYVGRAAELARRI